MISKEKMSDENAKPDPLKERLKDGQRLLEAIQFVIEQCENGNLSGRLGIGAMFKETSPNCALGYVADRAGGIPFLTHKRSGELPFYGAISHISITTANDRSSSAERHVAVQKPLREWADAVAEYIERIKHDIEKQK